MEKPAADHSCLWVLLCAMDYHRSEREQGAALQLHNSPTTLLWPAYLNSLTLVTLRRDECAYLLRLLAAGRESALPSMRPFLPFYYMHRKGGATNTSGKKKKKKKHQETCTLHEQLGKKKKKRMYPSWTTWVVWNLDADQAVCLFHISSLHWIHRFHWAINQDPYRVLPVSVFTMYNNRKAYFY